MRHTWTSGRCHACKKKTEIYRGICWLCRHPKEYRALLEAGVPVGSAYSLLYMARKCGTTGKAVRVLTLVHPVLMENVKVGEGFTLNLKDRRYRWIRRSGWILPSESTQEAQ